MADQPRTFWPESQVERLREAYGKMPTASLASELGRSVASVHGKAKGIGLPTGKVKPLTPTTGRWSSDSERETVRELYSTHTSVQIAERLYGNAAFATRVTRLAGEIGITKRDAWSDEILERAKALHAEGMADSQIRDEMSDVFAPGVKGREQVKNIRLRFKLPGNRSTEHTIEMRRKHLRDRLANLGINGLGDIETGRHRAFAAGYGLPEDLKPAQVRIVLALLDGPMTLPEIKAAIGARPENVLRLGTNATYHIDLKSRGLVAAVPTSDRPIRAANGRRCGPRYRYMLTAACLDMLASKGSLS